MSPRCVPMAQANLQVHALQTTTSSNTPFHSFVSLVSIGWTLINPFSSLIVERRIARPPSHARISPEVFPEDPPSPLSLSALRRSFPLTLKSGRLLRNSAGQRPGNHRMTAAEVFEAVPSVRHPGPAACSRNPAPARLQRKESHLSNRTCSSAFPMPITFARIIHQ